MQISFLLLKRALNICFSNPYVSRIAFLLFVYIKMFRRKSFLYMNENYNDCHQKKTTCTDIYIYIIKTKWEPCLYTKIQTLCTKQDKFRYVFYRKQDTLRYAIFTKILKLAFIYKKHDTSDLDQSHL